MILKKIFRGEFFKKISFFAFLILMINLVIAPNVDISCPSEVEVDKEFICDISVIEGEGIYDLKVEIEDDGDTVADIWDEEDDDWKSAYYYLNDFIEDGEEKEIKLMIDSVGIYEAFIKIRKSSVIEEFSFEIEAVEDPDSSDESKEKRILQKEPAITPQNTQTQINAEGNSQIISLNEAKEELPEEEVVVKKELPIASYLPKAVVIFILLLTGYFLWSRI